MDHSEEFEAGVSPNYMIVLDDDPMVHRIIESSLGVKTLSFTCPEKLIAEADNFQPQAAFIDIYLGSEQTGLEVVSALRGKWQSCPILIITADNSDDIVEEALACGANDFIRKPIKPKELRARLQARLGDVAEKAAVSVVRVGDVTIDSSFRLIKGVQTERYLSPTELNLLLCLSRAKSTVVARQALKRFAWGQIQVSDNALDRRMHAIRQALKDVSDQVHIRTVYGVGFVLDVNEG